MKGLTKRQKEILDFLENYIASKQYSPSFKEIADHFHFSSLGSVYNHIKVLKRKGFLFSEPSCARSLTTSTHSTDLNDTMTIDLIGTLSGKSAIELFPHAKKIKIPSWMTKNAQTIYFLQIKDDLFLEEGLLSGDLILIEPKSDAKAGETVIALANQQELIVKRYFEDPPYIRLESNNPQISPIILRASHLQVKGIICGLIRPY